MAPSLAHRRKQIRLKEYDYSQPGAYYVTMCTKGRVHYFGEIADGRMNENDLAGIAQSCWNELPEHYPNVQLDEFVIMPNHVHGIIILLDDMVGVMSRRPVKDQHGRDVQLNIPTNDIPNNNRTDNYHSRISPKRGTLGVLVRTYKAAVTTECRRNGHSDFAWQSGYLPREIFL